MMAKFFTTTGIHSSTFPKVLDFTLQEKVELNVKKKLNMQMKHITKANRFKTQPGKVQMRRMITYHIILICMVEHF